MRLENITIVNCPASLIKGLTRTAKVLPDNLYGENVPIEATYNRGFIHFYPAGEKYKGPIAIPRKGRFVVSPEGEVIMMYRDTPTKICRKKPDPMSESEKKESVARERAYKHLVWEGT